MKDRVRLFLRVRVEELDNNYKDTGKVLEQEVELDDFTECMCCATGEFKKAYPHLKKHLRDKMESK